MKRLPPQTISEKLQFFCKRYWPQFLSVMLWLLSVGFLAYSWSKKPEPELKATQCVINTSVRKGELIQSDQIVSHQVQAKDLSSNLINDCNNPQLTKIPVLIDLQAGDVLQLSVFQKPEELVSLKEQLAQKQQLFYLPAKDLHAVPLPVELGQELTILGKSKKAEEAQVLLQSVKVADISKSMTDDDQEQLNSIGFALDQNSSLLLTKALADGWFLVAVTK